MHVLQSCKLTVKDLLKWLLKYLVHNVRTLKLHLHNLMKINVRYAVNMIPIFIFFVLRLVLLFVINKFTIKTVFNFDKAINLNKSPLFPLLA